MQKNKSMQDLGEDSEELYPPPIEVERDIRDECDEEMPPEYNVYMRELMDIGLTFKQKITCCLMLEGYTPKIMAAKEGVSISAIKQRMTAILQKHEVTNSRELMALYVKYYRERYLDMLQESVKGN